MKIGRGRKKRSLPVVAIASMAVGLGLAAWIGVAMGPEVIRYLRIKTM